jgi:hypothetical protein
LNGIILVDFTIPIILVKVVEICLVQVKNAPEKIDKSRGSRFLRLQTKMEASVCPSCSLENTRNLNVLKTWNLTIEIPNWNEYEPRLANSGLCRDIHRCTVWRGNWTGNRNRAPVAVSLISGGNCPGWQLSGWQLSWVAWGGHGLLQVSPKPSLPYPSTPCGRAGPETAWQQFLGWPTPRACDLWPFSTPLETPRHTPMKGSLKTDALG